MIFLFFGKKIGKKMSDQAPIVHQDLVAFPKFDVSGDENTVHQRWIKWTRALQYKIDATGVTKNERKKAMLLHYAGMEIQEIWETLPEGSTDAEIPAGENSYTACVKALKAHFKPVLNFAFERREFHALRPRSGETTSMFCTRLQTKVSTCDFERAEREVADMLVSHCPNESIVKELLKIKPEEFNLQKVKEVIRLNETISSQVKSIIAGPGAVVSDNNNIDVSGETTTVSYVRSQGQPRRCWRCDNTGHFGRDSSCPARGRKCSSCGVEGHFAAACRQAERGDYERGGGGQADQQRWQPRGGGSSRSWQPSSQREPQRAEAAPARRRGARGRRPSRPIQHDVRMLEGGETYKDQYEYYGLDDGPYDTDNDTFLMLTTDPNKLTEISRNNDNWIVVKIGGVKTKMFIDSGTNSNILDNDTLFYLQKMGVKSDYLLTRKILYP